MFDLGDSDWAAALTLPAANAVLARQLAAVRVGVASSGSGDEAGAAWQLSAAVGPWVLLAHGSGTHLHLSLPVRSGSFWSGGPRPTSAVPAGMMIKLRVPVRWCDPTDPADSASHGSGSRTALLLDLEHACVPGKREVHVYGMTDGDGRPFGFRRGSNAALARALGRALYAARDRLLTPLRHLLPQPTSEQPQLRASSWSAYCVERNRVPVLMGCAQVGEQRADRVRPKFDPSLFADGDGTEARVALAARSALLAGPGAVATAFAWAGGGLTLRSAGDGSDGTAFAVGSLDAEALALDPAPQPVFAYDWDTVVAIRCDVVNRAIAAQNASPESFEYDNQGIAVKGQFGAWRLNPSGDGSLIHIDLPVQGVASTYYGKPYGSFASAVFTMEVHLDLLPTDVSGGKQVKLVVQGSAGDDYAIIDDETRLSHHPPHLQTSRRWECPWLGEA